MRLGGDGGGEGKMMRFGFRERSRRGCGGDSVSDGGSGGSGGFTGEELKEGVFGLDNGAGHEFYRRQVQP